MKEFLSIMLMLCLTFSLVACGGGTKVDANTQLATPKKGDTIATMKTNYGEMEILLFPQVAPKAVENFTTHAKNGYYDGLIFHRVISEFMIQGGDPLGMGYGGESIWTEPFEDEFSDYLSNVRGALSMANSGSNSNGSQFFIVQADAKYLDGKHTVFGQLTNEDSLSVLDKIAEVETDDGDKPIKDVVIESLVISTVE